MKIKHFISVIISIIPLFWVFCYYFYVVRAILYLGYIPSYDNPDPSHLFPLHRKLFYELGNISLITIMIGAVVFFIREKINILNQRHFLILFKIGVALTLFILFLDPFLVWFMD